MPSIVEYHACSGSSIGEVEMLIDSELASAWVLNYQRIGSPGCAWISDPNSHKPYLMAQNERRGTYCRICPMR